MKIKRYDTSEFGKRLRSLRVERGYSMDTFCERYNEATKQKLSKSTVSRWENNTQEPMLSTVASIADFFGVTSLWLLGETDDRSYSATNIQNSAVVQGNNATTLIVRNGKEGEMPLSDMENELLRIFQSLSVRGRTQLLTRAFELESEEKGES